MQVQRRVLKKKKEKYIFSCTAYTGPFEPNFVTKKCYKGVLDVQTLLLPTSTFGGIGGHLHPSQE